MSKNPPIDVMNGGRVRAAPGAVLQHGTARLQKLFPSSSPIEDTTTVLYRFTEASVLLIVPRRLSRW